jgi:NADPH2:quinone reductase
MPSVSKMRAWNSTERGIEALKIVDLAIPQPGPGEVLVQVDAAALNFSDLLMIEDRYQIKPDRPFVPGQEVAGTIVAVGEQSGSLSVGDRIASKVIWGGFGEQVVVRGSMAIRIPERMTSQAASALPIVYTTAMVALTQSIRVKEGDAVLVLAAAGGIGLAAVEIARHLGARVIAAAGGPEKCALARAHGAQDIVDYRVDGWSAQVKALTGGEGATVIVDPVGGAPSKEALRAIAWKGQLLIVGFASGEIPQIPANRLLLRRASAVGVYWDHDRDAQMIARVSKGLTSLAQDGIIRPHIVPYRFEHLPRALKDLRDRRTTGKAVLTVKARDKAI